MSTKDHAGAFLENLWYLALPGHRLKCGQHLAQTVLGEPLLIGRDQAGAVFAAGTIYRSLCREAGLHAFLQLLGPGWIMCEEPIRLHDIARVFAKCGAIQRQHAIN